jgi:hypothetical protein
MTRLVLDVAGVLSLLDQRGAGGIEHPGGTLLAHLIRVSHRLSRLSAVPGLQVVGLAHASYGTDRFRLALLDRSDRSVLRELIGSDAEQLVYRYAGCDRGRTWRPLAQTHRVWSRFDGTSHTLDAAELRAFVDLCMVIELDILTHSPTLAAKHAGAFASLFNSWRDLASPAVLTEASTVLTRPATPT